jgi:hypothetical protein
MTGFALPQQRLWPVGENTFDCGSRAGAGDVLTNVHDDPEEYGFNEGELMTFRVPTARGPRSLGRKTPSWPRRCKLAHAFLWEHSYNRLKLAQLLGQLGVFLTSRILSRSFA